MLCLYELFRSLYDINIYNLWFKSQLQTSVPRAQGSPWPELGWASFSSYLRAKCLLPPLPEPELCHCLHGMSLTNPGSRCPTDKSHWEGWDWGGLRAMLTLCGAARRQESRARKQKVDQDQHHIPPSEDLRILKVCCVTPYRAVTLEGHCEWEWHQRKWQILVRFL